MELKLVQQTAIGINQQWLDEWIAYRGEDKKKPIVFTCSLRSSKVVLRPDKRKQWRRRNPPLIAAFSLAVLIARSTPLGNYQVGMSLLKERFSAETI